MKRAGLARENENLNDLSLSRATRMEGGRGWKGNGKANRTLRDANSNYATLIHRWPGWSTAISFTRVPSSRIVKSTTGRRDADRVYRRCKRQYLPRISGHSDAMSHRTGNRYARIQKKMQWNEREPERNNPRSDRWNSWINLVIIWQEGTLYIVRYMREKKTIY